MATTASTHNFCSSHAMARVKLFLNLIFLQRSRKTRPTTASIELGLRIEQGFATTTTPISALFKNVPVFSSEWSFSAFQSANLILLGSEFFTPIGVIKFFFLGHNDFLDTAACEA